MQRRFFILIAGLTLTLAAHAQPTQTRSEAGRPFITNYPPNEYGAHPQNLGIIQDADGVMYFGNRGVLEYDGVSWRRISVLSGTAQTFAQDAGGRLYVGGTGDFGYLAPDEAGQMHYVSLLALVPEEDNRFNEVSTYVTPQGIYFSASSHVFRYAPSDGTLRTWKAASQFTQSFVVRGTFYVQEGGTGLMEMADDTLRPMPGGERFADEPVRVMLPYGEAQILVGTETQGLFLYDGVSCSPFPTEADAFLQAGQLTAGTRLANGTFALGTARNGLAILDARGRFTQRVDQAAGLQNNNVRSVYADRQGALWLGLEYGIARVETASPFTFFNQDAAGRPLVVYPSIHRHRGTLYVTADQGVYRMQGQPPALHRVSGINTQSWSLLSVGATLLAATSNGVYRIDGDRATVVQASVNRSYSSQFLHRSRQDSNRVFVGLGDGLASLRRQGDRWIDEGRIPGIEVVNPITIIEPEVGTLWLGTRAHGVWLVHFEDGALQPSRIERFDTRHGLPSGENQVFVTPAHPVVTTPEGLFVFDEAGQRFVPDTTFAVTFSGGVREVEKVDEDARGRVWIGSEEAGEMALATPQAGGTYRVERTPFLGLPRATLYAVYPEADGVVWFGGSEGLVRYDSNVETDYQADFTALIRRVTVQGDSILFGGHEEAQAEAPRLVYADNALRFEFAAPYFEPKAATLFHTYLEGFDRGWSAWSTETRRDYTNLPPGAYTFRVRARNVYEQESVEAAYAFTILPPWYRTWWAYALYAVLFGLGVFVADRVQRRRLLKKERARAHLREVELRAETAEAQAETAEAQAQALHAENERKKNVELLSRIGRDITGTLSIEQIIETVYEHVNALMDAAIFGIGLYDEADHTLTFPATKEKGETLPAYAYSLDDESRLAVWSARHREEILIQDYAQEYHRYVQDFKPAIAGDDTASILYLPLMHQERLIGVITAQSFAKDAYTEHHVNILRNLATYTAIALDNADAYRRLRATVEELNKTLEHLRATQEQLVQSEKMASLGQLTAGIAHEIKNPLNFVNNFADLNVELAEEVREELAAHRGQQVEAVLAELDEILLSLKINASQIAKHGRRADGIVQSMMQHASGGAGERYEVGVNAFVEEYVNLAYHGMRARSSDFAVEIERDYDASAGNVAMVPQEMGRVLVNLLNNAFDAVREQAGKVDGAYAPKVTVRTKRQPGRVEIRVEDNGEGIPEGVREKIFEPFFTTKPTGSGTGLGLSLSYDIVTKGHSGTLSVENEPGRGATFVVTLPL